FREAVLSAIVQVHEASRDLRVIRVERDEALSVTEIARRMGRTSASIRLLASGKKGPGGFPKPVDRTPQGSPLWDWADVVHWFSAHRLGAPVSAPPEADGPD